MKISDWLQTNTAHLTQSRVSTARLDCLVLLEDVLQKDRAYLLAHPELTLSEAHLKTLSEQIARRASHQPLAYIRGKTEFYGRNFIITPDVLEPRPESETMIELLLKQSGVQKVIDVGCGSGALAITAQLELPTISTLALDVDSACLKVTKKNIALHKTTVQVVQSDLLDALSDERLEGAYLLANLPYVPDNFTLNEAALNEPKQAIFGGPDGLDLYRRLFQQISARPTRPMAILCESLPTQHQALAALAREHGFSVAAEDDFIQLFK